jgi:hypothetical protein
VEKHHLELEGESSGCSGGEGEAEATTAARERAEAATAARESEEAATAARERARTRTAARERARARTPAMQASEVNEISASQDAERTAGEDPTLSEQGQIWKYRNFASFM